VSLYPSLCFAFYTKQRFIGRGRVDRFQLSTSWHRLIGDCPPARTLRSPDQLLPTRAFAHNASAMQGTVKARRWRTSDGDIALSAKAFSVSGNLSAPSLGSWII